MPKLENFAQYIKIDGNPHPKNGLLYQVSDNVVSLYYANKHDERMVERAWGQYDDWTKADDTKYVSVDELITDLDLFLFSIPINKYELAIGNIPGEYPINKFGRAVAGVQNTKTDIWDRADSSATQPIWLAPTAARIHTIASTSAQDTTGGTGVDTCIISYLPDWNTKETEETVVGDLNAGIAMNNAAVIIHRIRTVPQATTLNNNVGTITATAAADSTITAAILPNEGQTQMAIYGIPSTQYLLLNDFYGTVNKAQGAAATINFNMAVNPNPNVQTVSYLVKNTRGLQSTGSSGDSWIFDPPYKITGPAILKIQGVANVDDVEGSAGFNGIRKDI